MSKVIVAVYGTLLSGLHNHCLLEHVKGDVRFMGKARSDFKGVMYSAGGFPILSLLDEDSKIQCELYEVGPQTLKLLDQLEGYPGWYDRTEKSFTTMMGEKVRAFIYHQDYELDAEVCPEGDWKKFKGVA
ncbi:putative gamma-glutamylcyclotransferase [Pseudomonas phage BroderSalsa]|nr:putative gamma-glutamylcyclotransferase [Pseudomonas phage BroderSalsa]